MHAASRVVSSALFVDFDNVYLGLQRTDEAAAQQFATNPRRWMAALEDGGERMGEVFRRRFLVRVCYLNPSTFGRFRGDFARAGFRVVDCPSLTRQGKSGADIQLALDVIDAISHSTTYEEFVICSADADFTPLMVRLRAHDRRTVMVAAGPASSAYEAVCDDVMGAAELADAALGSGSTPLGGLVSSTHQDESATDTPSTSETDPQVEAAIDAIRALVAASPDPVPGANAASAVRNVAPDLASRKWGGSGFLSFCAVHLSGELVVLRTDGGGLLIDPVRHPRGSSSSAVADDGLLGRIRRLTGAPRLSSAQVRVVFESLVEDLATTPFSLSVTSRRVRDATAERGEPLGRTSISYVLQGLAYRSPESLSDDSVSARSLAEIWRDNVVDHCATVGMELSAEDRALVDAWILGDFDRQPT